MNGATVADVMIHSTVAVRERTPVDEVARALATSHWPAITVVDDDRKVVGIVTAADLLPLLLARGWQRRPRRADAIAHPVPTVGPDTRVADAVLLANQNEQHALPVVDPAGALLGMATRSDLVSALLRAERRPAVERTTPAADTGKAAA